MKWINEIGIHLIQEYQLKDIILWYPKNSFYYSKTKKQDAWEKIGKILNKYREEVKNLYIF